MRRLFSPEPGSGIPALLRAGVLAGGGSQTYSGSVVTFTAKRARAVKSLTAAIEPVQSGNGDPSPENVRPISGWDAVNVWVKATHDTESDPTHTIDFGRTVYGGSLDVTTGVLTVDRVLETLDGTETTYMRNTWGHYYTRNDLKQGRATDFYAISSQYTPGSHYWAVAGTGEILTNTTQYIIMDDRFSTVESWKAHLAEEYQNGTPVQVVYRLEEPQTYQLTPTEVETLLGDNCIWADTGDIIVIV